jgi:hypothetical protein
METDMRARGLIVAIVIVYALMLFGGAALKPGYSHIGQYISELNATGTPHASLIGWLGFVPFGVLAGVLLVATSAKAPVRGLGQLGYWMLLAEPIAYVGAALAPCDIGCPLEGSLTQNIHNGLGAITYLTTTSALLLLSTAPNLAAMWRVAWVALALIWFGLFATMVEPSLDPWRGILQRMAEWIVYPSLLLAAWRIHGAVRAV